MSWSGGKDGALALALTRETTAVAGLHTTVLEDGEVAASYVPRALVEAQAAALDLPLRTVELPSPCPNDVYEERTRASWSELRQRGATEVVYGDLYLADIRAFREQALAGTGGGVDPCGENGEFHTLVTDGPGFAHPVPAPVTGTALRDGFVTAVLGT